MNFNMYVTCGWLMDADSKTHTAYISNPTAQVIPKHKDFDAKIQSQF